MTDQPIEFQELEAALRRCGSGWNAGQAHGLLCGQLAVAGADGAARWLATVLEDTDPRDALRLEAVTLLNRLCEVTRRQLVDRQSEFELLLPDDDEPADYRAAAMGQWCDGFLHGLVSDRSNEALRQRLAGEPLADLIRDLLQITRAAAGDGDSPEETENAYAELVEYLRVAAQLAYEELSAFRAPAADSLPDPSDTLH